MPETQDSNFFHNSSSPKCDCQKDAPYLFIAPLDSNGDPVLSPPDRIRRVAICGGFKCAFNLPWAGDGPSSERISGWRDQFSSRGIGGSYMDDIRVRGDSNRVGDTLNLTVNLYQSQPHFLPLGPPAQPLMRHQSTIPDIITRELHYSWLLHRLGSLG
ncbi:hypothetical protein GGR51DRAFT_540875 [Nemania sp. FL0031]|nr:hypothetical protein GGR51DRAFT_540875 [Nemania sp. FL0031]